MPTYVNPGNDGFANVLKDEYVDKTGMIGLVSERMERGKGLITVSRPRRFGKTYAAHALAAYYCRGCDSRSLFEGLEVSRHPSFEKHLNAHDVIRLDMTNALRAAAGGSVPAAVERLVVPEIRSLWPSMPAGAGLVAALLAAHAEKGSGFVFIIDEWDAPMREAIDSSSKRKYLAFLRGLFNNGDVTSTCVEAAYLTGILPIVRDGTQSAIPDFDEYTIFNPQEFAPYVGFAEDEVKALCVEHGLDFQEMQRWYDGYELPRAGHVYSPYSVMQAVQNQELDSYWTSTCSLDSLLTLIERDFDGLQDTIASLVAGGYVPVNVRSFKNDIDDVRSADDVLTVLVHLGYLAYDEVAQRVRIPNEEVRLAFVDALKETTHPVLADMVAAADRLL